MRPELPSHSESMKKHLKVGSLVPLSIHYTKYGTDTLETLCIATAGNNESAGTIIEVGRESWVGSAKCNQCDYYEIVAILSTGQLLHAPGPADQFPR